MILALLIGSFFVFDLGQYLNLAFFKSQQAAIDAYVAANYDLDNFEAAYGPLIERPAPYVAIPTTAGTGAEVTRNAVLASTEHRVKVSLRSPLMLPSVAVIDPDAELVELAQEVMTERQALNVELGSSSRENADAVMDILRVGTSAGGARPKAVIAMDEKGNVMSIYIQYLASELLRDRS